MTLKMKFNKGNVSNDVALHINDTSIKTGLVYDHNKVIEIKEKKQERKVNEGHGPWNEIEHKRFLEGIAKFGLTRNKKQKIREYIRTRSNDQISSYTQKFFKRIQLKIIQKTTVEKAENKKLMFELIFSEIINEMQRFNLNTEFIEGFTRDKQVYIEIFKKKHFITLFSDKYITNMKDFENEEGEIGDVRFKKISNRSEIMKSTVTTTDKKSVINSLSEMHCQTNNTHYLDLVNESYSSLSSIPLMVSSEVETIMNDNSQKKASLEGLKGPLKFYIKSSSAYENLKIHFKKTYLSSEMKQPKASRYKKYIKNNFKSVDLENIMFLNENVTSQSKKIDSKVIECVYNQTEVDVQNIIIALKFDHKQENKHNEILGDKKYTSKSSFINESLIGANLATANINSNNNFNNLPSDLFLFSSNSNDSNSSDSKENLWS